MKAVHPALSMEAQLLLVAAGMEPDEQRVRDLVALPLDWTFLVQLAVHEKAIPVLWRCLEKYVPERVPAETRSGVQGMAMVAEFKSAMTRQRLGETIDALAERGIRAMVLKGAGLALTEYRSFGDRPMGDIDVLVECDRAVEAQSILRSAGWHHGSEESHDAFYAEHHHIPPLTDPSGSGVWVELHSDLFSPGNPFRLPLDEIWGRSREVPIGRAVARVADPHDAMVHLCIHFVWSHAARSGAWRTFRDVDALVRSGRIDWETLYIRAVSAKAVTSVYWTLRLANELAALNLPEEQIDRFRPRGSDYLLVRMEHHLATALLPSVRACPSRSLSRWMWEAAVQPRFSGHGNSRPWAHDQVVRETFLRGPSPTFWTRTTIQMNALRAWTGYLSAVLLRQAATRASP
jgi:hypothetical protein